MDNGEEIPGLNESWTFAGAKLSEWLSGFVGMMLLSEITPISPARIMPFMLIAIVGLTLGLASLRRKFPDEERGIRNYMMTALGFAPPGIPAPAELQPYWSGCRLHELEETKEYMQLGLNNVFPGEEEDIFKEEEI